MKPAIAKLCLKHLHNYKIQFQDPRMVADDGTIQTFNGVLCDLAPVEVCDWSHKGAQESIGFVWMRALPIVVGSWSGLTPAWEPKDSGITTERQLVSWLKSQAKGGE